MVRNVIVVPNLSRKMVVDYPQIADNVPRPVVVSLFVFEVLTLGLMTIPFFR